MSATHQPRKRFGQHFLVDPAVIDRILTEIRAQSTEHLVEIGPGQGALTTSLAATAGSLTLIELDRDLVAHLQQHYAERDDVRIVSADALTVDFSALGSQLRIVGNLPYNISTPLLFHLVQYTAHIRDMTFMLQKEVVDRITAEPGSKRWGRLGVMLALAFESEALFDVGPDSFDPPPKVNSAIVSLTPRRNAPAIQDPSLLDDIVRSAFSKRRKTLRNALKGIVEDHQFEQAAIAPTARPETLTADQYATLANLISAS